MPDLVPEILRASSEMQGWERSGSGPSRLSEVCAVQRDIQTPLPRRGECRDELPVSDICLGGNLGSHPGVGDRVGDKVRLHHGQWGLSFSGKLEQAPGKNPLRSQFPPVLLPKLGASRMQRGQAAPLGLSGKGRGLWRTPCGPNSSSVLNLRLQSVRER